MRALLLILALCALLAVAWDFRFAEHPLPQSTQLTDKNGRTIDVEIYNTSHDTVYFTLVSDKKPYSSALTDLNLISKYRAMRLQRASVAANERDGTVGGKPKHPSGNMPQSALNYINSMKEQIEKNNRRIDELNQQIAAEQLTYDPTRSSKTAKERSLNRELERLYAENAKCQTRIQQTMAEHSR